MCLAFAESSRSTRKTTAPSEAGLSARAAAAVCHAAAVSAPGDLADGRSARELLLFLADHPDPGFCAALVAAWKRSMARRKEFWEKEEYDLHGM